VAHVLAELLENALSFSPPEQSVEVKGRLTTGGYTVAISDNGLGMGPDDLERANRRLAGRESFTVAPSRYLGHYVAGHLASRLGVVVELHDSPAGGITARVDVPMGLLANEETDPRLAGYVPTDDEVVTSMDEGPVESAPVFDAPPPASVPSLTASGLPRRGGSGEDAAAPPAPSWQPIVEPAPEAPSEMPDYAATMADASAASDPWEATPESWEPTKQPDAAPEMPELAPRSANGNGNGNGSVAARGFGGLAVTRPAGSSMYSVAAHQARNGSSTAAPDLSPPSAEPTTLGGLARRVPGAQRPDAAFGTRAPDPAPQSATETSRTSPEDVYSFLSSFQSGVARGRADANAEDPSADTETMEDGQ
jgi:hypothetical protein